MAELKREDILANPQVANLVEIRDLMTYLFNPFRPHDPSGNREPSTPGPIPGMVGYFPSPEEFQADLDSPDPIMPQGVFATGGGKQSFPDWLLSGTSGKAFDLGLYGALGYGGSKIPIGKAFSKKASSKKASSKKARPFFDSKFLKGEQGSADFEFLIRALRQRLGNPKEALKSVPVKHIPTPPKTKKKKKKGKGIKKDFPVT